MFPVFFLLIFRFLNRTSHVEKQGSVQKGSSSKAAAVWASGANGGVREHDHAATCLREAAPAKAGNAAGSLFQHSLREGERPESAPLATGQAATVCLPRYRPTGKAGPPPYPNLHAIPSAQPGGDPL